MTESLARLTSMFESAKDLTVEAAASASARLAETPVSLRPQEISKLLSSRGDRDVLNGMKCIIAMMSRGEDAVEFFADVVKNITSQDSKVRNLVLIYITRYAEVEPDTALLSVNSIQKSLGDKNPTTRANAIKSLLGVRILMISPILLLCIKRTVNDNSPLVRASTAIAIGKVYEIDKTNGKQLLEYITKLLADSDVQVVSASIKIYAKIMGNNGDLTIKKWSPIHGNFRRFCRIVPEMDEWAQATVVELLTDYCRLFLPKPKVVVDQNNDPVDYDSIITNPDHQDIDVLFDDDYKLFIDSLEPLLYCDSQFVIISIIRALVVLVPAKTYESYNIAPILCRMISDNNVQIRYFAVEAISTICLIHKSIFTSHYRQLFIYPQDSEVMAKAKLDILSNLVTESNIKPILEEFKYNALNNINSISSESIKAMGRCSLISTSWNENILKWGLKNIKNTTGEVLNELLSVIRCLIQLKRNNDDNHEQIKKIVYTLSLTLMNNDIELESEARASIIWIIGDFTKECDNQITPDILRTLLKTFAVELEPVRYQILMLAAKLYSITLDEFKAQSPNQDELEDFITNNIISKMFQHTLLLGKFDPSYDTRDRVRMINVLLNSGSEQSQLASLFLQVPKPTPILASLQTDNSYSKALKEYFKAPDWSEPSTLPPSSIRKESEVQTNKLGEGISGISSTSISKKIGELPNTHAISSQNYKQNLNPNPTYKLESLDEFFGNEESEDEESEESEDEEESEESEESEEESQSNSDSDSDSQSDTYSKGSDNANSMTKSAVQTLDNDDDYESLTSDEESKGLIGH